MIAANNGWIIAPDNLSHISGWLSDALCRLSTGGVFSTRELYSDQEEVIFDAQARSFLPESKNWPTVAIPTVP